MREPLFILCPGGSFSSIVCAVIGQHPQAFGLSEVHLFVQRTVGGLLDVDTPVFGRKGASSGLKRAVAELVFGAQTYETIEQAGEWLQERRAKTGGQLFRELCELAGDRVVIDKSPTNPKTERLEAIYRAFPDARYLHLARHPRPTCRSRHKANTAGGRNAVAETDYEAMWHERHRSICAFSTRLDPAQYMYLQGEWFLERPDVLLPQICEWLDLSTDPAAIDAMMHPERSPFASHGPENARLGNNPGFIERPEFRVGPVRAETLDGPLEWVSGGETVFAESTRNLAHQLGYDR